MDDLVRESRRERYRLRRALRGFTIAGMQARCGTPLQIRFGNFFVPDQEKVQEYHRQGGPDPSRVQRIDSPVSVLVDEALDGPVVRTGGLVWCERFSCPVCGPLMWADPARDLQRGIAAWQDAGGEVLDVVLRLTPLKTRDLQRSLSALLDGWDAVLGRRHVAQKNRMQFLGLAGYHQQQVIGIDTDGRWDPCLRVLLFMHGQTLRDRAVLRRVENAVWQEWVLGNRDIGLRPPTRKRGISMSLLDPGAEAVARAVSAYVAGVGSLSPGTHTMLEILTAACTRDRYSRSLWEELEFAVRRRTMRRWSKGTRTLLGLPSSKSQALPVRDQEIVARWDADSWTDVETRMPAPLELVDDALATGQDPYTALAAWARVNGLPAPERVQSKKPHPSSKKHKNRRRK